MSGIDIINLDDWDDFTNELMKCLEKIGHKGLFLVRNFQLITCDVDENMVPSGETDRLSLAINTGTDRDARSFFWNAEGHDHDHDSDPRGKLPADIIYAYVAEAREKNYLVHYQQNNPILWDLTDNLTDMEGILIYDASKLERVSKNEHWFLTDPREALLIIFKLREA